MSAHGGKREGAGRKVGTGKYGEPTKAMRVPASLVKDVKDFIQLKKIKRQRTPPKLRLHDCRPTWDFQLE